MNDTPDALFFELPKEGQDALIRAGFKVFALNDYSHVRFADIEAEAAEELGSASPDLSRCFPEKKDFYALLYSFAVRTLNLELSTQIREPAMDLFDLEKAILSVETDLIAGYPYLFLFLDAVRLTQDGEGLLALDDAVSIPDTYEALRSKSVQTSYIRLDPRERFSRMIEYIKLGVMRDVLADPALGHKDYWERMSALLEFLRGLAIAL